jgi:acetyl/propionyl-CoA carboxylase alpha subunit
LFYSVNATAIHPGYGFLSESTELAEKCKKAGILFVGPSAACISAVGDKVSARQVAKAAGVPVIPGTEESIHSPDQVYAFANQFGYPVMLKARDGGGGRGIRMVHQQSEVADALTRCINESPSKQVFIEKAVIGAKHIEVQILGDRHGNVIHLFERDCSAQRRYQKILEVKIANKSQ